MSGYIRALERDEILLATVGEIPVDGTPPGTCQDFTLEQCRNRRASEAKRRRVTLRSTGRFVCERSFSQYICPSCNAGYCSLKCYRSEAHNQCTESFYRKAVEDQIRSEPNKSTEDRRKMLEMLKRLEEETPDVDEPNDEDTSDIDDDGVAASLTKRLADVDIDDVDPQTLWSLLNEKERAEFAAIFSEPQGTKARELLEEHDVDAARFEPWWTVSPRKNNKAAPLPSGIVSPLPALPSGATTIDSPNFAFNLFSICVAYAYTTRHLVVSPLASLTKPIVSEDDLGAARNDIAQAAPFLVDRRSTIIFSSVDQVITEIWSRMDATSTSGLIQLLDDTITLLQPSRVDEIPPTLSEKGNAAPSSNLHTVLADLRTLFLTQHPSNGKHHPAEEAKLNAQVKGGGNNHVALKLVFYATKASAISPDIYDQLRAAIRRKMSKLQMVTNSPESSSPAPVLGASLILNSGSTTNRRKVTIQEIG